MKVLTYAIYGIGFAIIFIGASAVAGKIFQLLWNACVSSAFGWNKLSFYQAWGIWLLIIAITGAMKTVVKKS